MALLPELGAITASDWSVFLGRNCSFLVTRMNSSYGGLGVKGQGFHSMVCSYICIGNNSALSSGRRIISERPTPWPESRQWTVHITKTLQIIDSATASYNDGEGNRTVVESGTNTLLVGGRLAPNPPGDTSPQTYPANDSHCNVSRCSIYGRPNPRAGPSRYTSCPG